MCPQSEKGILVLNMSQSGNLSKYLLEYNVLRVATAFTYL